MRHSITFSLAALVLTALACAFGAQGNQPGTVLFQDDFSNPDSNWDRVNASEGQTDYLNGVYRIYVGAVNTDVWANPGGLDFTNVHIEVDASKAGGGDNNVFGLICRYRDERNFYFLVVSSDGYQGIGRVKDGKQELLGSQYMTPTDKLLPGEASNRLGADCVGDRLALYANGERIGEVTAQDFSSGNVGLIAGSIDSAGVDIHFDNFIVTQP